MDYSSVIPQDDLEAYKKGGFGKRMVFGSRPCVVVIDMTYGFVDPKNSLAHGSMGFSAVRNLKLLLEKARAHGVPIVYTTGLNSISGEPVGISRKVVVYPKPTDNEIVDEIKPPLLLDRPVNE